MTDNRSQLFKYFLKREIKSKYIGNISGFSWVFIQPVITLIIYWYVFGTIFKQRIPEAENIGFIVYLAIGFWPWQAFSDSIIRSISSLVENDDLIGKIVIDFKLPVIAAITASFILNIIGYAFVIMGLVLFAEPFNYSNIPLLLLPLIQLYFLAIAIGLFLSATQIFIRDTLQFITTFITLWFFLTPIIYSETLLPEVVKSIIQYNPIYTPISFIHKALLTDDALPWIAMALLSVFIIVLLFFSNRYFNRLAPYFDEYK